MDVENNQEISLIDIENLDIFAIPDQAYTGNPLTPALTIKNEDYTLVLGTDYTVEYTDNTIVGIAMVTISGIGNYTGVVELDFTILPINIAGGIYSISGMPPYMTYTGESIELIPMVINTTNGTSLTCGTDFIVEFENNVNIGTATLTIVAIDNYTGTLSATFAINPCSIEYGNFALSGIPNFVTYDSSAKNISVGIINTDNGIYINQGTDYTLEILNNINVGTATVKATGIENYTGELTATFSIIPCSINNGSFALNNVPPYMTYTGSAITFDVSVIKVNNGSYLTKTNDFTITYENNINAGTATVKVIGVGNYTGELQSNFLINPRELISESFSISGIPNSLSYTSNQIIPAITVISTSDGQSLIENVDYTVYYSNNVNVGTATVTCFGINNYSGGLNAQFPITPFDIGSDNIIATGFQSTIEFCGDAITFNINVTNSVSNKTLLLNNEYTVTYADNINVGIAHIYLTGTGNYTGTKTINFEIQPYTITSNTIKVGNSLHGEEYTGSNIEFNPTVTSYSGETLIKDTDYTIAYQNNISVGKATAVISGIGNYTGIITRYFNIIPGKPSFQNVGCMTSYDGITLRCQSDGTGEKMYVYRLESGGTEINVGNVDILNTSSMYIDRNLEPSHTYVYRIRCIKYIGSEPFASQFSDTITLTTKSIPVPQITTALHENSNHSLTYAWSAVEGAISYRVKRYAKDGSDNGTDDNTKVVTSTSFTTNIKAPNATYYYAVCTNMRLNGKEYRSAYSSKTICTTAVLSTPQKNSILTKTVGRAAFNWTAISGASHYRIFRAVANDDTNTPDVNLFNYYNETSNTTFTDTAGTAFTKYFYYITAIRKSEDGEYNDYNLYCSQRSSRFSVKISAPPPTNVNAVAKSDSQITISWTKQTKCSIDEYRIYHRTSTNGTWSKVGETTGSSFTHTGLAAQSKHYYIVESYKKNNSTGIEFWSDESNQCNATTKKIAPKPARPSNFFEQSKTTNSVSFKWDRVDCSGYEIRYNGKTLTYNPSVNFPINVSGLSASTTYKFTLYAYNNSGTSRVYSDGNEQSVTTNSNSSGNYKPGKGYDGYNSGCASISDTEKELDTYTRRAENFVSGFKKSYTDSKGNYHTSNCTWWAASRYKEVHGHEYPNLGGIYNYVDGKCGKTIKPYTIAIRKNRHAIFVEYVNNNTVYFSEANYNNSTDFKIQEMSISYFEGGGRNIDWYIY